ncbi:MAG: quinolinate synthase NadA [Eubacteriales bacterium]|nr:quinolinate synthase NadA [Eubacteriales bacterium]
MKKLEQVREQKKQKDVVILAHYYADGDVQAAADYVGDSYALARKATQVEQKNILFCGVSFMGESAKLLNPDKNVYMAEPTADCPMAHMADLEKIARVRAEYPDVAVVCYVNSTAEIKAASDVCVTSSNAVRIVKRLENQKIYFIPDQHLARFVARQVPEKHFIFHDGFCPLHAQISKKDIVSAREKHPGLPVLTHPECPQEVLDCSDFVGSTAEIIAYAAESEEKEFLIATETGVFYELERQNPGKTFYPVKECQICPDMKKNTIDQVLKVLESIGSDHEPEQVILPEKIMEDARKPLEEMLRLAK